MTNPIRLIQTLRKADRPDTTLEDALNENLLLSTWMDSIKVPVFAVYATLLGGGVTLDYFKGGYIGPVITVFAIYLLMLYIVVQALVFKLMTDNVERAFENGKTKD